MILHDFPVDGVTSKRNPMYTMPPKSHMMGRKVKKGLQEGDWGGNPIYRI